MNKIYIGSTEVANVASGGSGGSGSADLSDYYNKSHIDASFGDVDSALDSIGGDIDYLYQNKADSSVVYNKSHIDASYNAIDASMRTFKPIQYTSLDAYETLVDNETVDENMLYVITDVASSDELSSLVTVADLNAEKQHINASLNETATAAINAANTSIGYWKDTHTSSANSTITTYKNNAVSAVQSQQTTSVNAVQNAQATAVNAVNAAAAAVPSFEVLSQTDYDAITDPDSNTIYFIVED